MNHRYYYCENYSDLIEDLIGGELDEPVAARVHSHVFACAECRARYETLQREREIYAGFLFAAEPPSDLWANCQTRLAAEKAKTSPVAETPAKAQARNANVFGFWRWSPAVAVAAVLLVWFGIGWLKFAPAKKDAETENIAEVNSGGGQSAPKSSVEVESKETADSSTLIASDKTPPVPQQIGNKRNKPPVEKNTTIASLKPGAAKTEKASGNVVAEKRKKNFAGAASDGRLTEEKLERSRLENLETETAEQIERVEMLLRSFRNARADEGLETFDVAYERRQARKLLDANVRLRRHAEASGNFYAEELLSRAESHLLDIANLENNPAPDRVLDIKERVKNQSIIASLQTY